MTTVRLAEVYINNYVSSDLSEEDYTKRANILTLGGFDVLSMEDAIERRSLIQDSHMILSEKQVVQAFFAGVDMSLSKVREVKL